MTPNDLILREALATDHDDIILNIARISRTSFTNVPFMDVIIKSMCYINLDGLHC